MRYVDDTLLLASEDVNKNIFDKFNLFHKNQKFTMNRFENSNVHSCKTSWIKSLYHHARKMCSSSEKFKFQIDKIKLFMPWSGYLLQPRNSFIN